MNNNTKSKNSINYTVKQAVSDFSRLLPYIRERMQKEGKLCHCGFCGCNILTNTGCVASITNEDSVNEHAALLAICLGCEAILTCKTPKMENVVGVRISAIMSKRIALLTNLRNLTAAEEAKRDGYPIVMQPLHLDFGERQAILFTEDKTFAAVAIWAEGDPLIVKGAFAREVEAISDSILSGKTEVYGFMGNLLITSEDNDLASKLSEGIQI